MTGAEQLASIMPLAGEEITLTRGSTSVNLRAVRGRTPGQMTAPDGTQTQFDITDWLIIADDTGAIGMPQRGDSIVTEVTAEVFTVAHPDQSTKSVLYRGNDKTSYRVHTLAV